jgi:putative spermidine/putrescine transport system permease protein
MTFVIDRNRLLKIIIDIFIVIIVIYALLPLMVIVVVSFDPRSHAAALPPPGLSLRWFEAFITNQRFLSTLQFSLFLAGVVATLSSLIALPCCFALAKRNFKGKNLLNTFFLSPITVPGVVTGGAMLTFFFSIGMRDAYVNVILAHIVITLPFILRLITSALIGFNVSLEEAAKGLGAGEFYTFRKVTIPLIMPGIVAGWVFGFVSSFGNVALTAFLTDYRITTFQVELLSYIQSNFDPMIAVCSMAVMGVTLSMLLIMQRFAGFDIMRKGL